METQKLKYFSVPTGFRGRNVFWVQGWWFVQASLFSLSPQFAYRWRRFLLRMFGAKIGKDVLIRPSAKITYPWKLDIGDYSWIGDNVELYTLGEIIIGKDVVVSQRSYLCTGSHDYKKIGFDIYSETIKINDQVWVATDVFIGPGVEIGEGAIVGARSSVFSSLEGGIIYAGEPAIMIKTR